MDDVFRGAGSLDGAYAAVDWAATALGVPATWSSTLRVVVDLTLNTDFGMTLFWGPEFTMLYNEAYAPMIGDKHPAALGASARDVFPEIWDDIGPLMHEVRDGGTAVSMPEMRLFLNRAGFDEETFFNFCYSPVRGPDGTVEGVVDIAVDTTVLTIARRRLELLTRLGQALAADFARPSDVFNAVLPLLRAARYDLPAVDVVLPGDAGDRGTPLAAGTPDDLVSDGISLRTTPSGELAWVRLGRALPESEQSSFVVRLSSNLAFDDEYRSFLRLIADGVDQALERIAARDAERRAVRVERAFSETLQRSMLTTPAQLEHVHVAVRYQPATDRARVGGDWYDSFLLPTGSLTVAVGDVRGHDGRAAASMAQVRSLLRGLAYTLDLGPAAALAQLDTAVQGLDPGTLATAVVARIEPPRAGRRGACRVRWSSAGHPPALLLSPEGDVTRLEAAPERMLGVRGPATRTDHALDFQPGSSVLLYTDGLVERRDQDLDDSLDALTSRLRQGRGMSADQLCDHLLSDFGPSADDDVAVLVVHHDGW